MSKALEEMNRQQIVLEDGRYMIFYTFAPSDCPGLWGAAVSVPEVRAAEAEEEN
jgi:hypothetical protein